MNANEEMLAGNVDTDAIVILMLILMLLNLNTDYDDFDADLCIEFNWVLVLLFVCVLSDNLPTFKSQSSKGTLHYYVIMVGHDFAWEDHVCSAM